MTLGEKIHAARQALSLSQKELAEKVNKSTADIAIWESDEAVPSIADIAKLSDALGVTTDSLIVDSEVAEVKEEPAVISEEPKEDPVPTTLNKSKKKLAILISACVVAIAIIGSLAYFLFFPFSKNTWAIEKATSSVVKIYCYDYEGNESATGSGFIVFDDKTVVTNYHVMEEAYTCKVSTDEDKTYEVESVLAYSSEQDIVIIKLKESTGLKVLKLGNSEKIKKGSVVTAIGSPLGIKNTVSQGVLSGRIMEDNMDILQFTAPISSGSSGGALFDESGKVVGVTFASFVDGQNLNLAIPVECVKTLYENKGGDCDVNIAYMIEHPYVNFFKNHKDITRVSFEDLKRSPQLYKGKLIAIDTYISSIWTGKYRTSYYFANKENVSGNHDYDESLRLASGVSIPYKDVPVMSTDGIYSSNNFYYIDTTIKVGDNVTIVGTFDHAKVGDVDEKYGIPSKVEYGTIKVDLIYKK